MVFHNTTNNTHQTSVALTYLLHRNDMKLLRLWINYSKKRFHNVAWKTEYGSEALAYGHNSMNLFKYSESELGVRTPRTASVLDAENELMTDSTCSDHFQMNRPWDFLFRRWFYENTFPLLMLFLPIRPTIYSQLLESANLVCSRQECRKDHVKKTSFQATSTVIHL